MRRAASWYTASQRWLDAQYTQIVSRIVVTPGAASTERPCRRSSTPACDSNVVSWPRWCVWWLNMWLTNAQVGCTRVTLPARLTNVYGAFSYSSVRPPAQSVISVIERCARSA